MIGKILKKCFGYIRVSTAKQGQGVSLQEQKEAIIRFAERNGIEIVRWFEERETAAKRGRPVFNQMLKLLKGGDATGIVIHKIDRSARNLRDWADLGELIDAGVDVYFANESLDLHSRGGRLSADIQAVVAADFIRNLKEEARKGFDGRVRQGLYPLPAPIGYLDQGKAKPKSPDPKKAPLVNKAFELYATRRYNIDTLGDELFALGLRNKNGSKLSRNGISVMLNNPFYIALIRVKKTGETFPGLHLPIVKPAVFKQVQAILRQKAVTVTSHHQFQFRRLLTCKRCGYSLIGERQKGHVYYRCHTHECAGVTIREESVSEQIRNQLSPLQFTEADMAYVQQRITAIRQDWITQHDKQINAWRLSLKATEERLNRLTDAYLDKAIDLELFAHKKNQLLLEKRTHEHNIDQAKSNPQIAGDNLSEFLELAGSAYLRHEMAIPEEKRDLLKNLTSNLTVDGKNVGVELQFPFHLVAEHHFLSHGAPYRDRPRTEALLDTLIMRLVEILSKDGRFGLDNNSKAA